MPARVHAVLVVRPDGRTPAAHHLRRTLAALAGQTRPTDSTTIVLCGADLLVDEVIEAQHDVSVLRLPSSTSYASAVAAATSETQDDALWLLAQDTAPERDALARLTGSLELSPLVAFVAPKLVRASDRSSIVSLGMSMTGLGRAVDRAAGDLDQGQHDGIEDVLGADVRAILVRTETWRSLGGLDPALAGADEGLDLGVRARLAGFRVALVPTAVVSVSGDGAAGLPAPTTAHRRRRAAYGERVAQLHRRLAYAQPWAVPLLWLAILPLAVWRSVLDLFRKEPARIGPEWAAALVAGLRPVAIARSRQRIRRSRNASWSRLAPLRVSRAELRERLDDDPVDHGAGLRTEGAFFSGGGVWLVLVALVASVAAFPSLLAWTILGGGGLQPLRTNVGQLWADTAYGTRALGLDTIGPADPFALLVAGLGSLWPLEPSRPLAVLWILALPLAALGGWYAATRVTERPILRLMGGAVWALAPSFLSALTDGRPAALIAHLLLPWLFFAGSVAHRSWTGAGAASLLLAAVVACAPSLAPALVVVWLAATILAAILVRRALMRMIWLILPSLALAAPFVWRSVESGDAWWMLADPGVTWTGAQVAADEQGRALLAFGLPTPDMAGWASMLSGVPLWWVPLLAAPLALVALAAPLTRRWAAGVLLLGVAALGLGTAFAAVGVSVAFAQSLPVPLWPGGGLSLAWLGILGAALATLDVGIAPRFAVIRGSVTTIIILALLVLSVPSLTAMFRGTALLQNGPESTLPAYVAAQGADNPDVGTLVLTPQNAGGVSARVVWGGSETLGAQSTVVATRTEPTDADELVAGFAAGLITGAADDIVQEIALRGVGFVLLAPSIAPESDEARMLRLSAEAAIDQRDGMDAVGSTAKGVLWRVATPAADRPSTPISATAVAGIISATYIAITAIALLLAIPTAATRREARRTPRVVGPHWQEDR
ncbi:glycosyltransferase [Microbacterium lacus]|uniref:glycosyltransferase n=1 Tax=Microbacterium lacus TaxID=415217 RepID=UPI00384FE1E6